MNRLALVSSVISLVGAALLAGGCSDSSTEDDLASSQAQRIERSSHAAAADAGFGAPIDSDRFGPVPVALLVGRAWFRYGPWGRIGRIRRPSSG